MKEFYRRHLPHWQPREAVFFVTFRLKNSLPYQVIESLCIMSNHVHAVIEPSKSEWHSDLYESCYQPDLPTIMQSLKRHTARQANILLGRKGAFWQDESYDHMIRDNEEYIRIINYVLENPVKVGLISQWDPWQWTYCKPGIVQ